MKKRLSLLLAFLLLLLPLLSTAADTISWADWVAKVNTATQGKTGEVVVQVDKPVEGAPPSGGYYADYLTLPDGVILVLVGRSDKQGVADFGTIALKGSARLMLQNVWVESSNDGIFAGPNGSNQSFHLEVDENSYIYSINPDIFSAGVYLEKYESADIFNAGEINGEGNGLKTNFIGSLVLDNSGQIIGYLYDGVFVSADSAAIHNTGAIAGGTARISNGGLYFSLSDPSQSLNLSGGGAYATLPGAQGASIMVDIYPDALLPGYDASADISAQQANLRSWAEGYARKIGFYDLAPGTTLRMGYWLFPNDGGYLEPTILPLSVFVDEYGNLYIYVDLVVPTKPDHNRAKVNGYVYSLEWLKSTFFGGISLDSFFLNSSDARVNHKTDFVPLKGGHIAGTFRTSKADAGMQYLVSPSALENYRRAGVTSLTLRNGSEYRDPRGVVDVSAVLSSLNGLAQAQKDDIRYLLFSDAGMEGDALYVDYAGNVKTMQGETVRTFSQAAQDTFPNFGRN